MPEPDAQADLQLLTEAAHRAGDIARRFFRADAQVWHKPDQAGPVTEADLAVNTMLEDTLRSARPTYGWLSEETPDTTARLILPDTFIIDPIDGTRAFIEGSATFAHSLATARNGQITAAVVYLPISDKLYAARKGHGATLNGTPLTASSRTDLTGASLLANKWTMEQRYWPRGVPPMERHFRSSLAYRMALIGEGRFDAMVTFRDTWEWDIAAGALITAEAGATVTDRTGAPLRFNTASSLSTGVMAGAPAIHQALLQAHA